MTARPIEYGLHINCAARPPTADYWCRCGFEDAAQGAAAVAAFANTIQRIHKGQCPNQQKGETGENHDRGRRPRAAARVQRGRR